MRNTITNNGWNTTEWGLGFLRVSSFPIDPSCTFDTEEEFQSYLQGEESDKPYLGQLVAVKTDKYHIYVIQDYDGSVWTARPLNEDEIAALGEQINALKDDVTLQLEALESKLKGDNLTQKFDNLSKIQDIILKHKVEAEQQLLNLQKELDQTQVGVGLSGDGAYNADQETYYLQNATSIMNALKTLDRLIHKLNYLFEDSDSINLNLLVDEDNNTITISPDVKISDGSDIIINSDGLYHKVEQEYKNGILTLKVNGEVKSEHNIGLDALVDDSYYDSTTETIVILFKLHDGSVQRIEIPAEELITEWDIVNDDSAITLKRERVIDGPDKVSAEINISKEGNNTLVKNKDGLYVEADPRLDAIYEGDKTLVTPVISSQWTIKNQNGDTVTLSGVSLTSNNITIEKGYKVDYSGTFKWTHNSTYKDPTSVSGNYGTTLPGNNTSSDPVSYQNVSATTTYTATLSAPKRGLMVSGTKVLPASGNDTSSATAKVTFQDRRFYGATITGGNIIGLTSNLTASRALTVNNITTNTSQYYCYAYPKSLGALTAIIQNGAQPIIDAFNRTEVTITNDAGLSIVYYVYTSKNVGAFTNATIEFK